MSRRDPLRSTTTLILLFLREYGPCSAQRVAEEFWPELHAIGGRGPTRGMAVASWMLGRMLKRRLVVKWTPDGGGSSNWNWRRPEIDE